MVMNKDSSLVRVESMSTEWEANLIVHRLESEGLRARAVGGFTAGFRAEAPGSVGILVDSHDASAARSIISEYFAEKKQRAADEEAGLTDAIEKEGAAVASRSLSLGSEAKPISKSRIDLWIWALLILNLFFVFAVLGSLAAAIAISALASLIVLPAMWIRRKFA
jgi:hypothetical protein